MDGTLGGFTERQLKIDPRGEAKGQDNVEKLVIQEQSTAEND